MTNEMLQAIIEMDMQQLGEVDLQQSRPPLTLIWMAKSIKNLFIAHNATSASAYRYRPDYEDTYAFKFLEEFGDEEDKKPLV